MDAKLVVTSRELKGSSNARRMRSEGVIPGVIYSDGKEARAIALPKHEFEQILHHHAGEQMMITIELDGKESSVLLKDVQHDVMSDGVLHVDLQEVSMNKKLRIQVPVELVGDAEGVALGGVLEHLLHSVEIECLPGDIVEGIKADVSALKIGDMLLIKDIAVDSSKYEILMDADVAVASVSAPRVAAASSEEEGEEAAEPEVIGEKSDEAAE
jgi:large subunit ribosomal protein L25